MTMAASLAETFSYINSDSLVLQPSLLLYYTLPNVRSLDMISEPRLSCLAGPTE